MRYVSIAVIGVLAGAIGVAAASAATLDNVKKKGYVQCGVSTGVPGFSAPDDKGNWTGFDVDYCRAVAAAIFDDPGKVRYSPLTAKDRFEALRSTTIDILSRNTTWTMSRDTTLGFNFAGVTYYDGQGFIVRKDLKVASAKDLKDASICTQTGTTTELNVADYFRANNMKYNEILAFAGLDETLKAYEDGRCETFTTDASGLYGLRLRLARPDDHLVLPEIISKEPLGPLVRHGDDQWFDLAKWVINVLVGAEELGISSKNVDEMLKSSNPEVRRMLGLEGEFGEGIGLTTDWAVRIIRHVGNYGEVFDRNIGQGSPLKIERGLNQLWSKGGLQYAMPIR